MAVPGTVSAYETYKPKKRQLFFHSIPALGSRLVKGAIGGYGGGKSTACEEEFVLGALRMPGASSLAVRKSVSGRAELSVLKDLRRIIEARGAGYWKASEDRFIIKCEFGGTHSMYVLPADSWERFGSMEIAQYFIQEAQEVSYRVFETLNARLRDPFGVISGRKYYRGFFDARGVERGHWIHEKFIEKAWNVDDGTAARSKVQNPNFAYVRFRTMDSEDALDPSYVADLILEHQDDPAWIDVFINGAIGISVEGKAVYGDAFDDRVHVADIADDPALPLMRGWDFGYRAPGIVWCQYTRSGRLLVLRELAPTNVSTEALIDMALSFQANEFPGRDPATCLDFVDAAGDQINSSAFRDIQVLQEKLGTEAEWRKGDIEIGLMTLRSMMSKTVKLHGETVPRFAVDSSCETLIAALKGSYHYPEENPKAPPIKGGSYVAVCDALRYVAQLVSESGPREISGYSYEDFSPTATAFAKF